MNETDYIILSELLVVNTEMHNQTVSLHKSDIGFVYNILPGIYSNFIKKKESQIRDLLIKNQMNLIEIEDINKNKSIRFNPLSFFDIGETMHSFLIAKLLNPYAEHGQGAIFINTFLSMLGIETNEKDHWIVTAEEGRIDVLLKRKNPHTVVVIENKSNYAIDQGHQIYRYWYQEIYQPNKHRSDVIEYTSNNINYQIIYLTPSVWKTPTENSLSKPVSYESFLPARVPIEPQIWVFNREIIQWLNKTLDLLPADNHRIREYINQYKELWN